MKYVTYKFSFLSAVHFGNTTLSDSDFTVSADTIFSALCQEAISDGTETLKRLYDLCREDKIAFSDAMPYIRDSMYVPKPNLRIEIEKNGNSIQKKAYKKLAYIPITEMENYFKGKIDAISENEKFSRLGCFYSKTSVSIHGEEQTLPYRVGLFEFAEGNGLYIIVGYEKEDDLYFVEELLISLSYSGIGGKRSSGNGRFVLKTCKIGDELEKRLGSTADKYMLLSVALPKDTEIENALIEASYTLKKRSGFVASTNYSEEYLRKRDLYIFQGGSCFKNRFNGDIYDVSDHGKHPVYRYAKPMFMGVSE